tara:strand:+ start:409 stop:645 length:237 start_codon:yes stop_codon:yes gene_type:complete
MNYNPNEKQTLSQNKLIKAHFAAGKRLTSLSALNEFGCFRLSARLSEIKDEGFPIGSIWIDLDNGKRIKEYYMANDFK